MQWQVYIWSNELNKSYILDGIFIYATIVKSSKESFVALENFKTNVFTLLVPQVGPT